VSLGIFILDDALWEPESDFLFSGVYGVGAVADVTTGLQAEVTADGSWSGSQWVRGTEHDTAGFDCIEAFDDKSDDWTGCHVFNKTGEE